MKKPTIERPQEQRQWAKRVVYAVNAIFPRDLQSEEDTWQESQRYLGQAQSLVTLIGQHQLFLPEAADVLDRMGLYLRKRALYSLAEPLLRQALAIRKRLLNDAHPDVAASLSYLASLSLLQVR